MGSFTFRKLRYGVPISIFTIQSDGAIYLNFLEMKSKNVAENLLESFVKRLNMIPKMNIPNDVIKIGRYYPISISNLTEEINLQTLKDAIIALCDEIEG